MYHRFRLNPYQWAYIPCTMLEHSVPINLLLYLAAGPLVRNVESCFLLLCDINGTI